jgi:hypothetical protein
MLMIDADDRYLQIRVNFYKLNKKRGKKLEMDKKAEMSSKKG